MTLAIREATKTDLHAVLGLYIELDGADGVTLTESEAIQIYEQFSAYPSYRLFVATLQDQVVASYALLIMHNLAHRGSPSAIVEDVVVQPHAQGQGIGRLMMQHALAQARQANCYKLALSSNSKRLQAHVFYQSLGFTQHGLSFVVEP